MCFSMITEMFILFQFVNLWKLPSFHFELFTGLELLNFFYRIIGVTFGEYIEGFQHIRRIVCTGTVVEGGVVVPFNTDDAQQEELHFVIKCLRK